MPLQARDQALEVLRALYVLANGVVHRLIHVEDLFVDKNEYEQEEIQEFLDSRNFVVLNYDGTEKVRFVSLTQSGADTAEQLHSERETKNSTKNGKTTIDSEIDIFVSHGSADVELATALVHLLKDSLSLPSERIRCTSVPGFKLTPGADTESQLRLEVKGSRAFVGLLTRQSIASTYVLFELGARWGAGLSLVPLLAKGATFDNLPGPLGGKNAIFAHVRTDITDMLDALSKELDCPLQRASTYEDAIGKLIEEALVGIGSEAPPTLHLNDGAATTLTDEARTLLIGAIEDPHGQIMRTRSKSGLQIVAGGRSFWDSDNPYVEATWDDAFDTLVHGGLIKDLGKGSVFRVSKEGYRIGEIFGAVVAS